MSASTTPSPPAPPEDSEASGASLATLFLTIFLDLLGFGLVVPFLPGVARELGAGDFLAAMIGASYSMMQFLFVPLWGRLSDRIGRRPVLLVSIAASVVGMTALGFAGSLLALFAARVVSGVATANIAVAQAYIADMTSPARRSRGMGLIGMAFGLGFVLGPFVGGELGQYPIDGRPGALAAFVAAGLSLINLVMAARYLPESLPRSLRGKVAPVRGVTAMRRALQMPGISTALVINFIIIFWFAGMEQTFRLFTEDGFGMGVAGTGRVLGLVGVVAAIVQGGLIHRLTRAHGEVNLVRVGTLILAISFALLGASPWFGGAAMVGLFAAAGLIAVGSGLSTPSTSSYVSQKAPADRQGTVLGALQSTSALGRATGPALGGLVYQTMGMSAPYLVGAAGLLVATGLAFKLSPLARHRRDGEAPTNAAPTTAKAV